MEDLIAYSERLPDEEPSARNLQIALAFKDDFAKQLRLLMALHAFHLSLPLQDSSPGGRSHR